MSVLIKGKALPKDCESCDLCDYYGCCYALCGDSLWDALPDGAEYFPDGWKYAGCPLVEIPEPHGDLIDRDALGLGEYEKVEEDTGTLEISLGGLLEVYHKVKEAPAIIAREDGETDADT